MWRIKFRYHDKYSHGKAWSTQTCVCENVNQFLSFYGLNDPNEKVEYEIIEIVDLTTNTKVPVDDDKRIITTMNAEDEDS